MQRHFSGSVRMTIESIVPIRVRNNQPDTKSNPNPDTNPKPTNKQHAAVSFQLNIQGSPKK